jgi:D-lyxose ketol-isomerase
MMKRSEINRSIDVAKQVFAALGIHLPPFAFWSVDDWTSKGPEADEIRNAALGWDVTDFGLGQFEQYGRTLFTLRNGYKRDGRFSKSYAEKFILDPPNQKPPLHFHRSKMEDIINRGGGHILIKLFASTEDGRCSDDDFAVQVDGATLELKAGAIVRLKPGQSICLPPLLIHQFWGEEGTGIELGGTRYTVSGEVSTVCDDWNDNCFLEPVQRFPTIEEDQPRRHYLCNEYPKREPPP